METHIPVFEWLRQCSKDGNITAEFGAINVTESKGAGRIVRAGRNIKDGERIVTIPLNCLMTSRDAKKCQLAREIKKSHATIHSEHTWLAVYLMEESRKGNTSRYWGYISSLPKSFESMPIFFSKELKAHLQGSIALSKITSMKKDLRRDFEEISEKVPGFAKYDYKEFEWSRLCVWTRVFSIELGGKEVDALVPIADMFNHSPQPQISWYFCDEEKAFCMTCEQDVPKGAQIFDSYGRKSMSRYFVNYGFTVGGNYTFNEAVIDVPLRMKGDRKCKGKHTKYADISPRGKGGKYTITTSLASFQKLSQRIQPERMFSKSIEGEIRLLLTIEKACKHALKRYIKHHYPAFISPKPSNVLCTLSLSHNLESLSNISNLSQVPRISREYLESLAKISRDPPESLSSFLQ
ncbi:hypothetical protein AAMO2058_000358500 [Amorphochlora amoebiformis]